MINFDHNNIDDSCSRALTKKTSRKSLSNRKLIVRACFSLLLLEVNGGFYIFLNPCSNVTIFVIIHSLVHNRTNFRRRDSVRPRVSPSSKLCSQRRTVQPCVPQLTRPGTAWHCSTARRMTEGSRCGPPAPVSLTTNTEEQPQQQDEQKKPTKTNESWTQNKHYKKWLATLQKQERGRKRTFKTEAARLDPGDRWRDGAR